MLFNKIEHINVSIYFKEMENWEQHKYPVIE